MSTKTEERNQPKVRPSDGTKNTLAGETAASTGVLPVSRTAKVLRFPTLRIVELMQTRVQSVRVDLIGPHSRLLVRLGTWLVFLPLAAVGYLLVLTALLRLVAVSIGWTVTLLVFGGAHLIIGLLGIFVGRDVGLAQTEPVLDPEIESSIPLRRATQALPLAKSPGASTSPNPAR